MASSGSQRATTLGVDRVTLRLAVLGILVVAMFVALFSRLWFLQVLAAEDYARLADENRVRLVHSEPKRGEIRDRHGAVLVTNRPSVAVTIDRQVLDERWKTRRVVRRLSKLLDVRAKQILARLTDNTVSPYKPVAVVNDISEEDATYILARQEEFRGVDVEQLPVRSYPHRHLAAVSLGYVGEISEADLDSPHFKGADPPYGPGDIVGKAGIEYTYDRFIRGMPAIDKVIVNSGGEAVDSQRIEEERPGADLYLSLDARVQKLAEDALRNGIKTARSVYNAPAGAVAVLDPSDGRVVALASFPTYDPAMLADGVTEKEWASLGGKTPTNPDDDAMLNRAIQAQRQPGSTFKVVTAGAAMSNDVANPYTRLECPGAKVYPPGGGAGSVVYRNWTSTYFGFIDFPTSLEISCDTFYYELGWQMEERWGAALGDGSERFQRYTRTAGFGHQTGIDLPHEAEGRVPDEDWCIAYRKATNGVGCQYGWLPGYSVNMAIGQGDIIVTPLQMAVTYAAIANGGTVWEPRIAWKLVDGERVVREFKPRAVERLPLDAAEIASIQEGLERVIAGANGTARGAFAGFPLASFPIAGKTGTAELGETDLNDAWFVSYGPVGAPRYVISVYVEQAGHGGESAAPIAREIWEGIFGIDQDTNVRLGTDFSG